MRSAALPGAVGDPVMAPWLAGLAVALAVAVIVSDREAGLRRLPDPLRLRGPDPPRRTATAVGGGTGAVGRWLAACPASRRVVARGGGRTLDVAVLAEQLSALGRAGLPSARAWEVLADQAGPQQQVCRMVAAHLRVGGSAGEGLALAPGSPALAWLGVASVVADRAGAPQAGVLAGFAHALRLEEAAAAERASALAGPRATAAVLSLLPVAGIVIGALLGGHPLATLAGTAPGRVCLLAGASSWVVGRRWTRWLVVRAERAEP